MPGYSVAMNTATLIQFLRKQKDVVKQVWLANDAGVGVKLERLYNWYELLIMEGKKWLLC